MNPSRRLPWHRSGRSIRPPVLVPSSRSGSAYQNRDNHSRRLRSCLRTTLGPRLPDRRRDRVPGNWRATMMAIVAGAVPSWRVQDEGVIDRPQIPRVRGDDVQVPLSRAEGNRDIDHIGVADLPHSRPTARATGSSRGTTSVRSSLSSAAIRACRVRRATPELLHPRAPRRASHAGRSPPAEPASACCGARLR